ncbi:MAG: GNAT family N-acetyltransferase [Proteobacteria bacterium]|nr:GNAT family N-acetyltransferase [Pseudomonadota bacterium]
MTVLETPRLALRRFTDDDAAFIVEQVNDPHWIRYIGERNVRSEDDARAYLARSFHAHYARHGFGLWAVEARDSRAVVGMCGLIKRDALDDVDLGYSLLPRYRGRGFAFEAARATLRHGHGVLGMARIVAITAPDNHRSSALLRALGMRYERTLQLPGYDGDSLLFASEPSAPTLDA